MKRSMGRWITAGLLTGSVMIGVAHAGGQKAEHPVEEGELSSITVSSVRIHEQAPTKQDSGNVHLEGELMNRSSVPLTEVELRVALTAPDSEEIEVDRRVRVPYDPAIAVSASELLSRNLVVPEAVKETLSQRKLSVSVVGATAPGE